MSNFNNLAKHAVSDADKVSGFFKKELSDIQKTHDKLQEYAKKLEGSNLPLGDLRNPQKGTVAEKYHEVQEYLRKFARRSGARQNSPVHTYFVTVERYVQQLLPLWGDVLTDAHSAGGQLGVALKKGLIAAEEMYDRQKKAFE